MCGIAGKYNLKEKINRDDFNRLRDTLAHRGPDGAGSYFSNEVPLALGHRRLSIIDLSETGSQPMHNEDKTIWLTINGEIYNYKILKVELEKYGHRFYSTSDSEVIIHGYEQWGHAILNKVKGMFAFALWDSKKKELFLARDRFGIKPLYYFFDQNTFVFGSEIKAILSDNNFHKELDLSSVADYMVYRYIPSPKSIWKNICKISPAHFITFNWEKGIKKEEYWKLNIGDNNEPINDVIEKTHHLLTKSIKEHITSDVPVGTFLSGGYDSSALVYYQDQIKYPTKTFSIGFENWEKSEHQYAETVAKIFHTEHQSKILNHQSLDHIDELMFNYDEPIADISIVPTYEVSKLASKNVKVVLSGEGADEIFAGYTWHHNLMNQSNISQIGIVKNQLLGKKLSGDSSYANVMAMGLFDKANLFELFDPSLYKSLPDNPFWFYEKNFRKDTDSLKSFQFLDVKTFMGELVLTKVDRASMANSLESRVPFLDHELVEYFFQLNRSSYYKASHQKYILFQLLKKSLPEQILNRKKQGFVGPDIYYQNHNWYKKQLESSELVKNGIINKKAIEKYLSNEDYWRLWKILILEKWFKKWA